jgi:hypothetical protein
LSRQELIYTGRTGNTISIAYREYRQDDSTLPEFSQILTYDLSQSDEIVFRKYLIYVASADNRSIRFTVKVDSVSQRVNAKPNIQTQPADAQAPIQPMPAPIRPHVDTSEQKDAAITVQTYRQIYEAALAACPGHPLGYDQCAADLLRCANVYKLPKYLEQCIQQDVHYYFY